MTIPIIIVDYNSITKTIEYIEKFSNNCNDWDNYVPIVIDNSENNDTYNFLEKEYQLSNLQDIIIKETSYPIFKFELNGKECIYVKTNQNLGYAKGNNIGACVADKLFSSEYYIISNNDLEFSDKFDFNQFEKIFDLKKDVGVIGPRIVTPDGAYQSPRKEVSAFKRLVAAPWISLPPFNADVDLDYTNESKYCYFLTGCFLIVKASCFRDAGGFDENTFLFGEECILSERMKKCGYKMWFEDSYVLTHAHGATINKKTNYKQRDKILFDSLRYYYKDYKGTSNFVLGIGKVSFATASSAKTFVRKMIDKRGSV